MNKFEFTTLILKSNVVYLDGLTFKDTISNNPQIKMDYSIDYLFDNYVVDSVTEKGLYLKSNSINN